jgi:hypothetical protein
MQTLQQHNPKDIKQMAKFRAVKKTELPEAWLKEAPAETLAAFAKMLDCAPTEIQSHTLWTMPETVLALQYQRFLMKNNDPEQVGLLIENFETWATSYGGDNKTAKERVIQELLDNFKATGHPKHICRCFGKRPNKTEDEDDPIESTLPSGKAPVSSEYKDDPIESTQPLQPPTSRTDDTRTPGQGWKDPNRLRREGGE